MPRDSIIDWSRVSNPQLPGDATPAPCLSCQTAGMGYATLAEAKPWEERLWSGITLVGSMGVDGRVQHGAFPARMPWEHEALERRSFLQDKTSQTTSNIDYAEIASCYPTLAAYVEDGTTVRYPRVNAPDPTYTMDFRPDFPISPELAPSSGSSPNKNRILLAVSQDCVYWFKTGLVVMDHGAVPSLVVDGDRLFLFCNAIIREEDTIASLVMAWTTDLVHWSYTEPARSGTTPSKTSSGAGPTVGDYHFDTTQWQDPSVVRKANGHGWYLFFTLARLSYIVDSRGVTAFERGANTFVATAHHLTDRAWTIANGGDPIFPDISLAGDDYSVYVAADEPWEVDDPNVVYLDKFDHSGEDSATPYYQYFAAPTIYLLDPPGTWPPINGMISLQITFDAVDFATVVRMPNLSETVTVDLNSGDAKVSNGLRIGAGEYRWFAFGQGPSSPGTEADAEIFSYTYDRAYGDSGSPGSSGTSVFNIDRSGSPVLIVDRSYESVCVQDAAVAKFRGCYVMAYVTQIP